MPIIKANNIHLHVQQVGPKGSEAVVMLHGLLVGSLAMWYFTAAPHLAKHRRVVMYDLRGHGKSDKTRSGYDIETMSRDLEGLIQPLGISTLSLVGHSYGALIALNYTLKNRGKVKKLALVEAPLPPSEMNEINDYMGKSPEEMVKSLPLWMQDMLMQGKRQALRLLQSLDFLAHKSTLLHDLKNETDIDTAILNSLNIPTLLIYGNSSSCSHVGKRLAKEIPGSILVNIPGGHYLPIENAKDVTRHLEEFLNG